MNDTTISGREAMEELKRLADKVSMLILHTDLPEVDIEIEISKVRQRCQELFPDRLDLFDMIYTSRFHRLMQQWRPEKTQEYSWNEPSQWQFLSSEEDDQDGELV